MKVVGISGTIVGSKTRVLVENVLEDIKKVDSEVEVELLDLKEYQVQFCDGRDPDTYEGDTKKVLDIMNSADCFLIGTPIFQSSLTGALKNLFDLAPVSMFRKKVIGFVATGGTYQHYLVIENQLKPIAGYFRAFVPPSYVYAHSNHFNKQNEIIDQDVLERSKRLAEELVLMEQSLG
ncbi:NADPH-dependent FMN reductase [Desertibacillus haloalkaliphilus]|uniref:NADPH-dependent FMN reductase n=1 Tax=Desertibacillus haloalkaliphilus TaxID=1328930 RepID=UPI001C27825F|nr:NAD(P)H-dependent oxidoreductase [Desertibacillus haloalkaliphilus]MBU8906248.1 NAD(P)H-dependent oxidoreductase [Desertibacillus haloalkaliphilus]